MPAQRLPGGAILAPRIMEVTRAGVTYRGEGMVPVQPGDPDYDQWDQWLAAAPAAGWDQDGDDYLDITAILDAADAAAAGFDPARHPRGWHGRFGHGTRPDSEPQPAPPRDRSVAELGERARQLSVRQRFGYHGADVDRTASKGFRVRLAAGEVQHYDHPYDAGRAARDGKHFDPRQVTHPELLRRVGDEGDQGAAAELSRRGFDPAGDRQRGDEQLMRDYVTEFAHRGRHEVTVRYDPGSSMYKVQGLPKRNVLDNGPRYLGEKQMRDEVTRLRTTRPPGSAQKPAPEAPQVPKAAGPVERKFIRENPRFHVDGRDRDTPTVTAALAGYNEVPPEIRKYLARENVEFYLGERPATELDNLASISAKHPSGYGKGKTFSKVAALVKNVGPNPANPQDHPVVALGGGDRTYGSGSVNVAAHEAGHALDAALSDISQRDATFSRFYTRTVKGFPENINPYYVQKNSTFPGQGRKEFFAETFAAWVNHRGNPAEAGVAITNAVNAISYKFGPEGDRAQSERLAIGSGLAQFYSKLYKQIQGSGR